MENFERGGFDNAEPADESIDSTEKTQWRKMEDVTGPLEANNLNDLYEKLLEIGSLRGSLKEYSAEDLIKKIRRAEDVCEKYGTKDTDFSKLLEDVTNTRGLRTLVETLLREKYGDEEDTDEDLLETGE